MKNKKYKNYILYGLKGESNGRWKGGIHLRKDGYVLVRKGVISRQSKGARYKLLHRIIMEEKLGRPLLRSEIVHHINHIRSDNRPENLMVMTQSEHCKLENFGKKQKEELSTPKTD